ncbi:MAG: aminopeptidase [Deltaproteobacteria bacterium]|nr:aminopeptidase [Deltaproteobacteria bacterium]
MIWVRVALVLNVLISSGCSLSYLAHVSWGQLSLMHERRNIQEAIDEGIFSKDEIEKLKLIQEVREFAIHDLHLSSPSSKSYQKVVPLSRDSVVYAVVVCPQDSLKPLTWTFPFSGEVSYLGFFNLEKAKNTQTEYEEDHYDVYVRGVSAYSTLGWFEDPIYSTMLRYAHDQLVNLVIHELMHETVYLKGKTDFNEGLATFVGNQGALLFLEKKFGKKSKYYQHALDDQADEALFSNFMKESSVALQKYYTQSLPREEKIKQRGGQFEKIKGRFQKLKPKLKLPGYRSFDRMTWNNAVFAGWGQYLSHLDVFEKVWIQNNRNLVQLVQYFKEQEEILSEQENPIEYLNQVFSAIRRTDLRLGGQIIFALDARLKD